MSKRNCTECDKLFPAHLIQIFFTLDGERWVCPICALKLRNRMHGLPPDTPFHGERALALYNEALDYLAEREEKP